MCRGGGGGRFKQKTLPWEGYGYFLEEQSLRVEHFSVTGLTKGSEIRKVFSLCACKKKNCGCFPGYK